MTRHYFIDIDPLAQPRLTGVGKVVELLAEAMPKRLATGDDTVDLVYADPLGRRPLQLNRDLVAKNNTHLRLARLMFRKVYGKLLKYRLAPPFNWLMPTTTTYDAAIFPNFASFPMWPKVRSFPVIHDLTFLYFPERVEHRNLPYLKSVVPRAVRTAHSVVTVSEQVKAELMKEYSLKPEQVIVIPLVPRLHKQPDMGIFDKLQIELGKYILFVGAIEPRKNLVNLIDAYVLLPAEIRDTHPLVLVGPLGWKNEELMAKLETAKAGGANIIMAGFVSEPEKAALFANATTFVLPAVYEGFGIPPMEAMSVGTPVIASDLPVTHEVLGDAGYYMDQNNPQSIADAIAKMVGDKTLRQQHSQRSLARMAELNKSFEAGCDELARHMKGEV